MRQLTEDDIREAFANASDDELRLFDARRRLPADRLGSSGLPGLARSALPGARIPDRRGRQPADRRRAASGGGHVPRGLGTVQRVPHDAARRSGVAVLRAQGGRCGAARRHGRAPICAPISLVTRTCAWPRRSRRTRCAPASTRASTGRVSGPRHSSNEYWNLRGLRHERSGSRHRRRADRRAARRPRRARVRRGSGAERRGRAVAPRGADDADRDARRRRGGGAHPRVSRRLRRRTSSRRPRRSAPRGR